MELALNEKQRPALMKKKKNNTSCPSFNLENWCDVTLFALALHLKFTALSLSESSNFFRYIIILLTSLL